MSCMARFTRAEGVEPPSTVLFPRALITGLIPSNSNTLAAGAVDVDMPLLYPGALHPQAHPQRTSAVVAAEVCLRLTLSAHPPSSPPRYASGSPSAHIRRPRRRGMPQLCRERLESPELQPRDPHREWHDQKLDGDRRPEGKRGADSGHAAAFEQVNHQRQTADRHARRGAQQRNGWLVGML